MSSYIVFGASSDFKEGNLFYCLIVGLVSQFENPAIPIHIAKWASGIFHCR
jgi:hypothetical protein